MIKTDTQISLFHCFFESQSWPPKDMFPTVGKGEAWIISSKYLCWENYTVDVERRGMLLGVVQGKQKVELYQGI